MHSTFIMPGTHRRDRGTRRVDAVVIGGGPAGLAISHCLSERAIGHVVLERGRLAEQWRTRRWDSLRLLTPNWMTRLPGRPYTGDDPDGFMPAGEVVDLLADYARSFGAPISEHTTVERVSAVRDAFVVRTDRLTYEADHVVIATGASATPAVPAFASRLSSTIRQLHSSEYRNPGALVRGGVLVVGASSSGLQIADEIARSGRDVVLAVGRHTRLPRTYRGVDIHWWLDRLGLLDVRVEEIADLDAARREPSLQLVGDTDGRDLDLAIAVANGCRLTGRLVDAAGSRVSFDGDLDRRCAAADDRLARILDRIDVLATGLGLDGEIGEIDRPRRIEPGPTPPDIDLREQGIRTVIWATGYRRDYPWLDVPVVAPGGELRHSGGVTDWPGLYAIGLPFMRRRKSTFLDGIGADAVEIADHLTARADLRRRAALLST